MGVIAHLNLYWPSQMRRKTNVLVYSMVTELNTVMHEYIVDDFFRSYWHTHAWLRNKLNYMKLAKCGISCWKYCRVWGMYFRLISVIAHTVQSQFSWVPVVWGSVLPELMYCSQGCFYVVYKIQLKVLVSLCTNMFLRQYCTFFYSFFCVFLCTAMWF